MDNTMLVIFNNIKAVEDFSGFLIGVYSDRGFEVYDRFFHIVGNSNDNAVNDT